MKLTLQEIANLTGGRLAGDGARVLTGVASVEHAGEADLTFVADAAKLAVFLASGAGAALVPEDAQTPGRDVVHHKHPHAAMRAVLLAAYPEPDLPPGISPQASVSESSVLGDDVRIAPYAFVDDGAQLGDGVRIHSGVSIGRGVRIGAGTRLHANAVVYPRVTIGNNCRIDSCAVIGRPGFGYVRIDGQQRHVPQVGGVVVGDDVDVGACACVDGGSFEPTRIGDGAKIDNLVQVGHNCDIGARVFLCSQAGLAGSSNVGPDSMLGGQVGVVGHLTMGARTMAAGRTMVAGDVADGHVVAGVPHMDAKHWRRVIAVTRSLPDLRSELRALQRRVTELESCIDDTDEE